MAAFMVKSHGQFSLLRQFLTDGMWREQSANNIAQVLCISCVQRRCYHGTNVCLKKAQLNEKEKLRVLFKEGKLKDIVCKKSEKKLLPTVDVWKNITVRELTLNAGRDVDDVLDAFHIVDKTGNYNPDTVLTNLNLVFEVNRKLGCKSKNVVRPSERIVTERKYKDIVRSVPDESVLVNRHPVVTIMGHVDHGKTTLLDALRDTSVVDGEFGGITQHIGAFNVTLKSGDRVTFLDTPGHAAFSSMRHRGAHITDIVVLVVAADDGVKEQTLQSIEMAKEANVPIIVAINKIDKPIADIKRTEKMLAENDIVVEALGGDVQCVKISALKKTNLEELTEAIVLQAELMGLKGDPVGLVEGIAIECTNSAGRGKLVTALIKRGTLRKGNFLVSGLAWAKVRGMFNDIGRPVSEAKLSEAVQIIGWKKLPNVGDEVLEVENERAVQIVLKHRESLRGASLAKEHKEASDERYKDYLKEYKNILAIKREIGLTDAITRLIKVKNTSRSTESVVQAVFTLIVKGDVAGSVEAILDMFDTYPGEKLCRLDVVHYGIGPITETDVELAETFNAIIYRFNVNASEKLQEEAKKKGLAIRKFNIIYKLFDDVKQEINKRLPLVDAEEILGEAKVQQEFMVTEGKKKVKVAGCNCTKGVLQKSGMYRLVRGNEVIYTGKLSSMRHLKEEVASVKVNIECGLRLEDPTVSFQAGDTIVCFKPYKKAQIIDWDPGF